MAKVQHYQAVVEDRTIFFELTAGQFYEKGEQTIPIHWEDKGQVFVGEMMLQDVFSLDIQPE